VGSAVYHLSSICDKLYVSVSHLNKRKGVSISLA
jgi:hypothetical protein